MVRKTRNPGAGRRQGFDLELVSEAGSEIEHSPSIHSRQVPIGAIRLAQRFGLSVATAAAVAEANSWGR